MCTVCSMQIGTLGDAWSHGARVAMHCAWGKREGAEVESGVQYSKEPKLETLICTRGLPDQSVVEAAEMPVVRQPEGTLAL